MSLREVFEAANDWTGRFNNHPYVQKPYAAVLALCTGIGTYTVMSAHSPLIVSGGLAAYFSLEVYNGVSCSQQIRAQEKADKKLAVKNQPV